MILVQREFHVPPEHRARFEALSREGIWDSLLHFGVQMVAYGSWGFGGADDVIVTNTAYEDLDHWAATLPESGAYHRDPAMLAEIAPLNPRYAERDALASTSQARLIELDDAVSRPRAFRRRAGQRLADRPPTFGRGSMISERTLAIADGMKGEFRRLSAEIIWPYLESQGGRVIGLGADLMGPSNEVTTWFAFNSLAEWYRFARPQTANAPSEVANAFSARANLVRHQRGRLMIVDSDWGAPPPSA